MTLTSFWILRRLQAFHFAGHGLVELRQVRALVCACCLSLHAFIVASLQYLLQDNDPAGYVVVPLLISGAGSEAGINEPLVRWKLPLLASALVLRTYLAFD